MIEFMKKRKIFEVKNNIKKKKKKNKTKYIYPEVISEPRHQKELDPSNDPELVNNQWPSDKHKSKNTSRTYFHHVDFIRFKLLQI